jgi:hypothetical protein
LAEEIARVVRARQQSALGQGMMRHGFRGAAEITATSTIWPPSRN